MNRRACIFVLQFLMGGTPAAHAQAGSQPQPTPVAVVEQHGIGAGSQPVIITSLLGNPAVLEELKFGDEDRKRLADAERRIEENKKRLQDMMRGQLGQTTNPDERQAVRERGLEAWSQFLAQSEQVRLGALTPAQRARLRQIQLQAEGPMAFARPEVLEQLNLDPDQLTAIQAIVADGRITIRKATSIQIGSVAPGEIPRNIRYDQKTIATKEFQDSRKKSLDATIAARESVMAAIGKTLTKGQRSRYQKMIGPPFDLAKARSASGAAGATSAPTQPR